jgi:PAS domain S-box-containing protein
MVKIMEKENLKETIDGLKKDIEDLERYIEEFESFLPIAVCGITQIGIITFANRAFFELSGYNGMEVVGEPIEKFFLEKEKIKNLLKEIILKESIEGQEMTLLSKEKKEIAVSLNIKKRKDEEGNVLGYFVGITNISELKKFQRYLEKMVEERTKEVIEEKNKTLSIVQNFTDGIIIFDKQNKVSLINPKTEEFFNTKSKKILGKSILELTENPSFVPLVNLLGKEIKKIFRKKIQLNENLFLEVSSLPIIKENEVFGTMVILHDVTREKIIEKTKTEFVSISAHQMRTPLSAIKWTLRMLLDGDLGPITEEQKNFLEKIYKSNEKMIALINDLLNVSRIEEGRFLYHLSPIDFVSVIESTINFYQKEIREKNLTVLFQKPTFKIPTIIGDQEKIQLAIQNLLENSIKFTKPGGEIVISLKPSKNGIEFSIKDNGVGIPKKEQWRVFDKFFRGSNIMRMETEGTGLGLFITKNIIEAHGGKIWFESEEGKGTTFYFTLPTKPS